MKIKDIAQLAGVGISTVSRVLNNYPDVNKETRERVLKIIEDHNYTPNDSARLLKLNDNNDNIGIVVEGVYNEFFAEMERVISTFVGKTNYTLIINHDNKHDEDKIKKFKSLLSFINTKKLKGLVYLGGNYESIPQDLFNQIPCKIVFLNTILPSKSTAFNYSSVGIDNYLSGYTQMEYLLKKGHKYIGIIISDFKDSGVGKLRFKGYTDALKNYNIEFCEDYIIEGHYNYEYTYNQTLECLRNHSKITAICSSSDAMSIGALRAVHDRGLTAGKDIDLISFDGMDIVKFCIPSITTFIQPRREIALSGIELLIELIETGIDNYQIIKDVVFCKLESC
ncbi:MAG: HTH-type transcriptional regulator MalR [Clostridiales bacterium]|jgi:LacI family transcriptional regulator|nr:HTH-type transcriptional regulator MalR [Clostridiales bacterium]